MIKVVHISTYVTGGAGRAAFRLHKSLLKHPEIESTFISASGTPNEENAQYLSVVPKKINKMNWFLKRAGILHRKTRRNQNRLERSKDSYECFSFPQSEYCLESIKLIKQADIIHLHWVAGFINYETFFKEFSEKKIIWTLHDMNPFMGGFHYQNDQINNSELKNLEEELCQLKKKNTRNLNCLTIVSPSEWLTNKAIKANFFNSNTKFQTIPYGLDLKFFKLGNRLEAKKKLNLGETAPCILIIAENLENKRKGIDLFCGAIQKIPKDKFQIISIGSNKLNINSDYNLIELGRISDDNILNEAYCAADLVVIPSREDNLPNVLLESFACGRPVLSFKVGGLIEWIKPGFNGILAEAIDEQSLIDCLNDFLNNQYHFNSRNIRDFSKTNFDETIQSTRYLSLYTNVLNPKKPVLND